MKIVPAKVVLAIKAYSILFYPITLEGRRGTTDEVASRDPRRSSSQAGLMSHQGSSH